MNADAADNETVSADADSTDADPAVQPSAPAEDPAPPAEPRSPADRLFAGAALGLMGLLFLCVVLVLIAWSRG